jgi:hypothetical protein
MGTNQGISLETIVALVVGVPALLIALATLWIGYLSFSDSRRFRQRNDLESQAVISSTPSSTMSQITASDDIIHDMPACPSLARLRPFDFIFPNTRGYQTNEKTFERIELWNV